MNIWYINGILLLIIYTIYVYNKLYYNVQLFWTNKTIILIYIVMVIFFINSKSQGLWSICIQEKILARISIIIAC